MKLQSPRSATKRAFSLAEVLIATAASTIIMGALVVATTSLSRTFQATEAYARAQSGQVRLIDSLALDLRRSVAVSTTDTTPLVYRSGLGPEKHLIDHYNFLTIRIPGYYESNVRTSAAYRRASTLFSTGRSVRYGGLTGIRPFVTVQYRKAFVREYGSQCYIRREAGVDQVIVEKAEAMDLDITTGELNSFIVDTWFVPSFSRHNQAAGRMDDLDRPSGTARLTSSDRVMLRNPRIDL
jgi:hypothetical protein